MISTVTTFQNETVFTIGSEAELHHYFRPTDRKKLVLPSGLQFPLHVRSYFTWREPSGVYTYLVFRKPNWDMPRGMVFKRLNGAEGAGGLCSWCHSYGSSDEIGPLSVAVNANTSFGYILCQDLRCIEKIEEAAALAGKNPEKAIYQLYDRIGLCFENVGSHRTE